MPNFRRVHDSLCALGIDTESLYRELGIRERDLDGNDGGVSLGTYLALLNRAAEKTAQPFLGIAMAQTRDITNLGTLGYMLRNAPDVERCLTITNNYLDLVTPGCEATLSVSGDDCVWTYRIKGFTAAHARQEVELTLAEFVTVMGQLLSQPEWRPTEACLQHSAPVDDTPLRAAIASKLTFDHFYNGVKFSSAILRHPISNADPDLLRVLEQQVQTSLDKLKDRRGLRDRVTFLISSGLGKTDVSAESVARHLGMSRRTLGRRLRGLDTSFGELRDIVIGRVAKESLATTNVSITELAQQLGYADSSAFIHSFRRLAGCSPGAYRSSYLTPTTGRTD